VKVSLGVPQIAMVVELAYVVEVVGDVLGLEEVQEQHEQVIRWLVLVAVLVQIERASLDLVSSGV
jgi:negative regulator of replication initiation